MQYLYICLGEPCDYLEFTTNRDMGENPYCPCCGGNDDVRRHITKEVLEEKMKWVREGNN